MNAVQEAISSGRLSRSIGRDAKGRPYILGAKVADAEWAATTRVDRIPLSGPAAKEPPAPLLAESRARKEAAEAELAEIELAEKQGELLEAHDVESRLVTLFSQCKTKLLGIPSRARQQDPTLSTVQIALIETLLRDALEDLATEPAPPARARAAP